MLNVIKAKARRKWLIDKILEEGMVNILDAKFVDSYIKECNISKFRVTMIGAYKCRQLGEDLASLYRSQCLIRTPMSLSSMPVNGGGRTWVYVYQINKEKECNAVSELPYERKISEGVVVLADSLEFLRLKDQYYNDENGTRRLVKELGLNDDGIVEKIIDGGRLDARTYSLFLLICNEHERYVIKDKGALTNENIIPPMLIRAPKVGSEILQYRNNCHPMRQHQMAWLLGLSGKKSISHYENVEKTKISPSIQCWTLWLLITNQHPYYELESRISF